MAAIALNSEKETLVPVRTKETVSAIDHWVTEEIGENEGFADVKQRLKKYELFKPTYEGAVPGNPGTAPPVIQLYSPAQSTGQFHQRNDR